MVDYYSKTEQMENQMFNLLKQAEEEHLENMNSTKEETSTFNTMKKILQ